MSSSRRHRSSRSSRQRSPSPEPDPKDIWHRLNLFPTASEIAAAVRFYGVEPLYTDVKTHLASTYYNGVEPNPNIIPDVMEGIATLMNTGQAAAAMESLRLIEMWIPCRAKLAVLHEVVVQAVLTKNCAMCLRVLEAHGFVSLFFELPLKLAVERDNVRIVAALVSHLCKNDSVDAFRIAEGFRVDESDEKVAMQIRLNRAGLAAAALEHTRSSRIRHILHDPLLEVFGQWSDSGRRGPKKQFEDITAKVYSEWPLPLCKRIALSTVPDSVMPRICKSAMWDRLMEYDAKGRSKGERKLPKDMMDYFTGKKASKKWDW